MSLHQVTNCAPKSSVACQREAPGGRNGWRLTVALIFPLLFVVVNYASHTYPTVLVMAPSVCMPDTSPSATYRPENLDPPVLPHEVIRRRSYKNLHEARAKCKETRKYNTETAWRIMAEECRRRTGLTPYAEQLDLAECMLLGLDATSIAGTGWGKTLTFLLPLFVPESKGKIVVIVSPLNALETDQVSCPGSMRIGLRIND